MEDKYTSARLIDGKPKKVIVDKNENIINKNPSKEELKDIPYVEHRRYKCTDDELLEYLRKFYEENGRIPMKRDFINNSRYPCFTSYVNHFGSWNNAIEMAELEKENMNDELLEYLRKFYEENGRPPIVTDFKNNSRYPSYATYWRYFGGLDNARKLLGLDTDTMVRKGILDTRQQKGRLFEMIVLELPSMEGATDISGTNYGSTFDRICPKGHIYDAKSSKLYVGGYWSFSLKGADRYEIEWFYLGAFDKDYNKLLHAWRIPGDFTEGDYMTIGIGSNHGYNIGNMREYEITEKFKDIFK